jgi:hypothetical protein
MRGSSGVGQSAVSFQYGKCVPEDAIGGVFPAAWGLQGLESLGMPTTMPH